MSLALAAQARPDSLESRDSAKDYAQTVVTLREALHGANLKIFLEVDHRANAINTDVDLPPSRVFVFGSPEVGSYLMKCAPLAGVDLPMRMLVRKDSDGQVRLYWTPASELLARYEDDLSEECQALAAKVDSALEKLALTAAAPAE